MATPLPLPTASAWSKFKQLVISGKLGEELMAAYKYVGELPKMEPAGRTCATRELADVRKLIADNAEGANDVLCHSYQTVLARAST